MVNTRSQPCRVTALTRARAPSAAISRANSASIASAKAGPVERAANETVRRLGTDDLYAKWKMVKFAIYLLFSLAQAPFLMKHVEDTGPAGGESQA